MDDLIIIGSGPAGLSAALSAARRGARFTVLTKDTAWLDEMLEDVEFARHSRLITGYDLLKAMNDEAHRMKVPFAEGSASKVYTSNGIVMVEAEGRVMAARSAIIATGRSLSRSQVKGAASLEGKGLSYWPSPDPEYYKGMVVALVCAEGVDPMPAIAALRLAKRIILAGEVPRAPPNVEILGRGEAIEIEGNDTVVGLKLSIGGKERAVDCDSVLMLSGFSPNSGLLHGGKLNKDGEISIGKDNMTSVKGVFAAGDVTDVREKQIFVALGEGAKAASSALEYAAAHPDSGYDAI